MQLERSSLNLPPSERIMLSPDMGGRGGMDPRDVRRLTDEETDSFGGERIAKDLLYADQRYVKMHEALKSLATVRTEKGKVEIREVLERERSRLMGVCLDSIGGVMDDDLLRFRSPYPYSRDAGGVKMLFDSIEKSIRATKEEYWAENPEVKVWLDTVRLDVEWMKNSFALLEGWGVNLPDFYSGMNMLAMVSKKQRTDPTMEHYLKTFASEIPGMKIDKDMAKRMDIEPIREKAVKFQDDAMFWAMAVAEVQQMELKPGGEIEPSMMKDEVGNRVLSDAEIEFIRLVFGKMDKSNWVDYKGHEVPREILNWYTMSDTLEEERRYLGSMEVLLTAGVRDSLIGADDDKVEALAEMVRVYLEGGSFSLEGREVPLPVSGRLREWYKEDLPLDTRLANLVVKSTIVLNWGHLTAWRLGWGFSYKEDGSRKVETGGTTVATDLVPRYWLYAGDKNEGKAWPAGMVPPASKEFISRVKSERLGWQPSAQETVEKIKEDSKLQAAWGRLWKDLPLEMRSDPKTMEMVEKLKGMVWYVETPFKDESGRNLIIPMFFPAEIKSLNVLSAINLGKGDEKESVWSKLKRGAGWSLIKWEKVPKQRPYGRMISWSQIRKILAVWTEKEGKMNADQFRDFFEDPSKKDELEKRSDLTIRDEEGEAAVLSIALQPMLVAFRLASVNNLWGGALRSSEDEDERKHALGIWTEKVSKWISAFEDLPDEKGNFKGYNEMMKRLYVFYLTVLTNVGLVIGDAEEERGKNSFTDVQEAFTKDLGVVVGRRKGLEPTF